MGYDLYAEGAPEGAEHDHLERTNHGIIHLADALVRMGMGFHSDPPDLPDDPEDDAAAELAARDHTDPAHKGIPTHKMTGGQGGQWWVTREECADALEVYDAAIRAGGQPPEAFHADLIPFLRTAARYDGFRTF